MQPSAKRTLALLALVCIAPVAASYAAFYLAPPAARMNHGELLEPRLLPRVTLSAIDGQSFTTDALRGRWVLVTVDAGECADACARRLWLTRQVRTALGKEMERVERLWLVRGAAAPAPALLAAHPGLRTARADGSALTAALPASGDAAAHIYLVDPLGNLMMRYPAQPDAKRMIRDLERLLKYSRIG